MENVAVRSKEGTDDKKKKIRRAREEKDKETKRDNIILVRGRNFVHTYIKKKKREAATKNTEK